MNVPEEAVKDPEPSESKRMKFSFAREFKDMLNMKLSIFFFNKSLFLFRIMLNRKRDTTP
jgi:hypothetical protein